MRHGTQDTWQYIEFCSCVFIHVYSLLCCPASFGINIYFKYAIWLVRYCDMYIHCYGTRWQTHFHGNGFLEIVMSLWAPQAFLRVSQSQNYFTKGGLRPIGLSWRKGPWDSRHNNFIFQMNTCGYRSYITSSLTRGWVCRLQLLLALASAVILRSESHGTHDHILQSQIRDSPNL
jgi:hypothetical protein